MFTINIYLRFALMALLIGGGILLAFVYSFWYAFPLILIGLVLLGGYIALGTVQSAAGMMQDMKFDEAEKRLDLTFKPEWLYATNRAYYFMIKGNAALNRKDNEGAEKYFNLAKDLKLPSDNEKAMILLQLANIDATKGKWQGAKLHFRELKKLNVTEPMLKEQVKQFEKAISNRGQMKHVSRGGGSGAMMSRGGKRKRPKMR